MRAIPREPQGHVTRGRFGVRTTCRPIMTIGRAEYQKKIRTAAGRIGGADELRRSDAGEIPEHRDRLLLLLRRVRRRQRGACLLRQGVRVALLLGCCL
ncbi:hypothetical protein [Loktanella atrilutea]|uniref:hypothetical protein n=1 Tax=Loktanella atrilutea TaxID=366533 RepID=UPI001160903D|nr:hypothetical protein [Loktanella atrilutea]